MKAFKNKKCTSICCNGSEEVICRRRADNLLRPNIQMYVYIRPMYCQLAKAPIASRNSSNSCWPYLRHIIIVGRTSAFLSFKPEIIILKVKCYKKIRMFTLENTRIKIQNRKTEWKAKPRYFEKKASYQFQVKFLLETSSDLI